MGICYYWWHIIDLMNNEETQTLLDGIDYENKG